MEETIGPAPNPVQSRHKDTFSTTASRKSDVKYRQNKAM